MSPLRRSKTTTFSRVRIKSYASIVRRCTTPFVICVFYASGSDLPKKFVGDLLTQNRAGLANTAKERPFVRATYARHPLDHHAHYHCAGHNRSTPRGYRARASGASRMDEPVGGFAARTAFERGASCFRSID